ncbi:MAGE family-domain-containing protein [Rhexocercosporidium sp. MPI-PUGE-AT-0058]|nr:MAGE family-domain-containing protein [Rhexocercosporidium sp. MPI-PUGE-AT-0058]
MPSAARRRRIVQQEETSEEEAPRQTQRERRHQAVESDDESEEEEDAQPEDDAMDVDGGLDESQDQVVKKMVRYALACEFQRKSIKRQDISDKVIGKQHRGAFKRVFESAQNQLRTKFGMEMVELPVKTKNTMKEKRAALKTKGNSKPIANYILTTILPPEYRSPEIMPPSTIGSEHNEASYMGICTAIVSIIALSPNDTVPDHKLYSYLERLSLEKHTGLGTSEALLARMIKDQYIYKTTEKTADDETIDWRVGPRGKVEIGNRGIQGLVNVVYGEDAPEDLEKRLHRSLGIEAVRMSGNGEVDEEEEEEAEETMNGDPGPSRTSNRRQSRR